MTVLGSDLKRAGEKAKNEQAKYARLKILEQQWEERQKQALRGQQAALKEAFYARHPELAA